MSASKPTTATRTAAESKSQASHLPELGTAEEYFKRALESSKLDNLDNYEQLIADCTKAIELDPKYIRAYCFRAAAHNDLGNHQQAIADCTRAIELDPKFDIAYNNRGIAYHKLGNHQQALADCTRAIELDPKYANAYDNRGNAHEALGNHREAIDDYTRAIELDPKDAMAYSNRGGCHDNLGNHQQAIADCTRAIDLDPKLVQALNSRGLAYHNLGNYQQAIANFNKAIELNPQYATAYNNRGNAYRNIGNKQQSLADYTKAIELNPKYANTYNNRGVLNRDLGRDENAIDDYNEAIRLNPNFSLAYNNRGLFYNGIGLHSQAIIDATKAIELNPRFAAAYFNLGAAHYRLDNHRQAIADLTRAIELDQKDAYAYWIRAGAFEKIGDSKSAHADLTQAKVLFHKQQNQKDESSVEEEITRLEQQHPELRQAAVSARGEAKVAAVPSATPTRAAAPAAQTVAKPAAESKAQSAPAKGQGTVENIGKYFKAGNIPAAIAEMRALPASVTSVYLGYKDINTPEAIAALCNLPASVTSVDLRSNGINTPKKIAALCNLPASVTSVDLRSNGINTPEAIAALCNLPASVNSIDLEENDINTSEKSTALMDALLGRKVIKLNLMWNNLSDAAAQKLAEKLRYNNNLLEIDLRNNGKITSFATLAQINALLDRNKALAASAAKGEAKGESKAPALPDLSRAAELSMPEKYRLARQLAGHLEKGKREENAAILMQIQELADSQRSLVNMLLARLQSEYGIVPKDVETDSKEKLDRDLDALDILALQGNPVVQARPELRPAAPAVNANANAAAYPAPAVSPKRVLGPDQKSAPAATPPAKPASPAAYNPKAHMWNAPAPQAPVPAYVPPAEVKAPKRQEFISEDRAHHLSGFIRLTLENIYSELNLEQCEVAVAMVTDKQIYERNKKSASFKKVMSDIETLKSAFEVKDRNAQWICNDPLNYTSEAAVQNSFKAFVAECTPELLQDRKKQLAEKAGTELEAVNGDKEKRRGFVRQLLRDNPWLTLTIPVDNKGNTLLHKLAAANDGQMIKEALAGQDELDIEVKNSDGNTPRDIARATPKSTLSGILKEKLTPLQALENFRAQQAEAEKGK